MNKHFKLLLAVLAAILIPLRSIAQQPVETKLTEINIHNVETIEERVFLIHSIQENEFFSYRLSDEEGMIDIYVSDNYTCEESNANADFDAFLEQLDVEWMAYNNLDKSERGRLFVEWRYQLDDPVFLMINEDFYSRLRSNNLCDSALPFCTDNGLYQFPAGVNAGNLGGSQTVPYYCSGFVRPTGSSTGCLSTTPNPAFYYMQIDQPGNLNIYMYSTPSHDIDFDCWGPFSDITTACSQISCSNMVDCSYSASATENCYINNAQSGQYYILLITNYSNATCNISFSNIGTGTTNCGIMPPLVDNTGPYCVGETIYLTANGQAGASYSWTGPAGFSSNQQNPTRPNCTMNMAGTYTCTISVGSATNSAETEVVIYPQPTANFNFTTVCQGNPTQFSSTSTTNPSGQQITSYNWNFGDGQTSTLQNPSHTYTSAGTYQVTLTVACGNGLCTDQITKSVTVYAAPVANAGPDQTIPYGSTAQLSGSGGAGTFNYHWEPANMVTNANAQNTQTVALTQDQTYTLTVTNPQGDCSSTDQVTIHISGSAMTVTANATPSSICLGNSTQLQVNAGGGTGNFTYSWTPTTNLSNPNIYNPIATPTQTTTYTCHVSDGQTSQDVSVTVTVHFAGSSEETHYICPNGTYEWHGQTYSDEGDYEFPTVTQYGCDSIVTLHLRHYPTYDETLIEEAICSGESYNFFGTTYTSPVQTSHTLQTIHGCDSIIRLNLTVWPEHEVTLREVSLCPEQLPYNFYGVDYFNETDVTVWDTDVHGCDSAVRLVLTVSDYYMPEIQTEYVCYTDTPTYDWNPIGNYHFTLHEDGFYADTLPTSACEGIFRLNLNFQQVPETIVEEMITCDSYTWPRTGQTYTESGEYYHYVSLDPFPCQQEYKLKLTINTQSLLPDKHISDSCDFAQILWFGQDTTFTANTVYTFRGQTDEGCYREQTYYIENMHYTPNPNTIKCSDGSVIVFGLPEDPDAPIHDTAMCAAVVTNTEFFSFQYTFYIEETNRECVWNSCDWTISKPSWGIEFSPAPTLSLNGKYYSECTVYVAERDNDYVVLTAKVDNGCGGKERRFYLKSSFLDVEENSYAAANVNIVPNPNNGQMRIGFENMEGRTSVKVFDMTGNQIDAFETTVNSNHYNYDYNMKRYAEGIYFFVVSNSNRVFTKKVVIIQ